MVKSMIVQNTGNIRQALSSPGVHVDGETYRRTSNESQSYSSYSLFARENINGFYKIMRYVVIIHVQFSETCVNDSYTMTYIMLEQMINEFKENVLNHRTVERER